MYRKLITTCVVILLLLVVFLVLRFVLFPVSTVEITGTHDPVTTTVTFDGKKILPHGDGGKLYSSKLFVGNHSVSISGPYVEPYVGSLDVAFASGPTTTVEVKSRTIREVVNQTINSAGTTVSGAKVFNTNWIVAYVEGGSLKNENGDSQFAVVLHYDQSKNTWEYKIDFTTWLEEMPEEARSYLYDLSED